MDTLPQGGKYGPYTGLLEGTYKYVEIPNSDKSTDKGGYILEVGGASSEISATDGTAPIAYGALVKVEIFFDYIVEG